MEARAIARYVRMSPQKVRRVMRLIKGLPLKQAQAVLDMTPNLAARAIRRVLDSAAANAENNHDMDRAELWIAAAHVDEGPTLRRFRSASQGRVGMIRRRMSHISIVVSDKER